MMNQKRVSRPFICPTSGDHLQIEGDSYTTSDHAHRYPVIDGIPILLPDSETHLKHIEQLQNSHKGAWFCAEQVEYYDQGPYRHHLARRSRIVQKILREYFETAFSEPKTSATVLDLGCGDGASTRWLISAAPQNAEFLLTDFNFDRLKRANTLLGNPPNISYFLSDITKNPVPDNTCDLVFCHHVIEHIPNDEAVFQTGYRVLKPGGMFLLGCPNEGVFWWMLAYALRPSSIRRSDHLHFYNANTLIAMGQKHGFVHQKTHVLGYGIPHWRLDAWLRQYKCFDDLFHMIGSRLFKGQGSALYLAFTK